MGGARINVLAIRETVRVTPGGAATLAGRAEALVAAEDEEQRRISALRQSFEEWTTDSEPHADAHWFEAEGETGQVVTHWGRRGDAIVMGKPPHWREKKLSLRAVLPALRWLPRAEQIHVLIGSHHGAMRLELPSVFLEHGLAATVHALPLRPAPFGQTLLEAAHSLCADLLIMGAYAHSPLGDLVLGGVTRHVLDHSDLLLLMRH